jgi:alpha-galactosidase
MLKHDLFDLEFLGNAAGLWRYQPHDAALAPQTILPPVFEIDSQPITASLSAIATLRPARLLPNGCTEYCFGGPLDAHPDLLLEMIFRVAPADPVLRFRYRLTAQGAHHLTKQSGHDHLRYAGFGLEAGSQAVEVVFSEFQELTHAYSLAERPLAARHFQAGLTVAGPILAAASPGGARLWAYEHGSTLPNTYVHFRLGEDVISLEAARGNYFHNQPLDADHPYETIWLQFAAIPGSLDDLAAAYRRFVLEHLSLSSATRQPHIFYNTWNYQERNFHWNGQPYLASMNAERMLAEIEVAHRMGIDVFVIDTGWYAKTGDWQVDTVRFPHGLGPIKARLDEYGMRLGLWFNPLAAAVSSQVRDEYADCVMSWEGVESPPQPVWETEASQPYCLASRYAEAFAETLIRLNRELGVTYFKWDGIHQGGCSSPRHAHGSESNPEAERAACYEFQMVAALVKIAETVNAACPDAIVDLDLTEGGRCMGLAFLSAGKYFLINNGPYYANYDLPMPGTNENMFFFPGWARAAICRTALAFDKWLPSVLFLTHYLPDDTPGTQPRWCQPEGIADSQEVNLASLILGWRFRLQAWHVLARCWAITSACARPSPRQPRYARARWAAAPKFMKSCGMERAWWSSSPCGAVRTPISRITRPGRLAGTILACAWLPLPGAAPGWMSPSSGRGRKWCFSTRWMRFLQTRRSFAEIS